MNPTRPSAPIKFRDRRDAGRELASLLTRYASQPGVLVLGVAAGGVPVGFEVAQALRATFDVYVVRKLPAPKRPDLTLGAIAAGVRVLNRSVVESLALSDALIAELTQRELKEMDRQEAFFRDNRRGADVEARTVILVDDGIVTGSTMRAAVKALRLRGVRRLIVAAPTAALETAAQLRVGVDALVVAMAPGNFRSVGEWYRDFPPVTEQEVKDLLAEGRMLGNRSPTLAPFPSSQSTTPSSQTTLPTPPSTTSRPRIRSFPKA